MADFVHLPGSAKAQTNALTQRWAVAHPGPEGFVIGRVGVPSTLAGFERIIEVSVPRHADQKRSLLLVLDGVLC